MKLSVQIVAKYPFTIEAKKPDGEWVFLCAVDNRVKADHVAEAFHQSNGMEVRVAESK